MKVYKFLLFLASCTALTSCFKDEPLNAEADIVKVRVPVKNPQSIFFQDNDTVQNVLSTTTQIVFDVKDGADLSAIAPEFTLTEGATITPASGTVRDFSDGKAQTYIVTSQDGQWSREYSVSFVPFCFPGEIAEYVSETGEKMMECTFAMENVQLDKTGKYYEWDGLCTANPGFSVARSTAKPDEYPSIYSEDGYKGKCAVLRTVSTGPFGVMSGKRIASGNLFLGSFDMSKALTQTLKATLFGVPAPSVPLSFSGYYKYKPGDVMTDKDGKTIEGAVDKCAIYCVLYKNTDINGNNIVLTGEDVLTNPNIVAVARYLDIPATDEWKAFNLKFDFSGDEIDQKLLEAHGYSLAMVFSASENGDLFEGAIGSTLCVDEVKILFKK